MTAIRRKLRLHGRTRAVPSVQTARFRAEADRPAGG